MADNFGVKNFTNIDNEDFEGMFEGKKAFIKKGKTVAFPVDTAKHLAGQLATKILIKKDVNWNKDPRRAGLIAEILGEELLEDTNQKGIIKPLKPIKNFEPGEEPSEEEAVEEPEEGPKEEGEFEELEDKETPEEKSEDEGPKPDYSGKSFDQLKKIAKKQGIEVKGLNSKDKLIKALK